MGCGSSSETLDTVNTKPQNIKNSEPHINKNQVTAKQADHTSLKKGVEQWEIAAEKKDKADKQQKNKKQSAMKQDISQQFSDLCIKQLALHNSLRAKHHAPPLVLSKWLCDRAQSYADKLTATKKFEHSDCIQNGKTLGQNIYWISRTAKAEQASNSWYAQIKDYDYSNGEDAWSKCGHFTQIIWVGTKEVGFGFSKGNVVGNYYPAGNMMGSFSSNVKSP